MMIRELRVKRFKKFDELAVELQPFTVLMGENNSGKTTVLQAINLALLSLWRFNLVTEDRAGNVKVKNKGAFWRELGGMDLSDNRELFYAKRHIGGKGGGALPLEIEVEDQQGNIYRVGIQSIFGSFNVKCLSTEAELTNFPLLHKKPPLYISGFVGLQPEEERSFPRVIQSRLDRGLVSEVLRNVLLDTKENAPDAFESLTQRLNEDFNFNLGEVSFDQLRDVYVSATYDDIVADKSLAFSFNSSGSGFMQVLQILAPIYRYCPSQSDVVLLDEPDAHLHPNLQASLARTLHDIQEELDIQIIVSTHSTPIIRASDPSDVVPISAATARCKPLTKNTEVEEQIRTSIDTFSLAKSLISGKLVFTEDRDTSILEAFDKVCGTNCFNGPNTVPLVSGIGRDSKVPYQIAGILKELLGVEVEVHFIRDRDGLPTDIVSEIQSYGTSRGVHVHIIDRFAMENYLLDAEFFVAALEKKYPKDDVPNREQLEMSIAKSLRETIEKTRYDYLGKLSEALLKANLFLSEGPYGSPDSAKRAARELQQEYESADDIEDLLANGIGKDALSIVLSNLNQEGLNLSSRDLLSAIQRSRVPDSIAEVLSRLQSKEAKPRTVPPRLEPDFDREERIQERANEYLFNVSEFEA